MRKITSESAQALQKGYSYKSGNTQVIAGSDADIMLLHGHEIAMILKSGPKQGLYIRSAGWETATTKERLNGLVGVHIIQKAGQWYLNGKKWENSDKWTLITRDQE